MNTRDALIKTWVAPDQSSKLSQLFARNIGHLPDSPLEAIFEKDFRSLKLKEIFDNHLSTQLADVIARNMKDYFAEEVASDVTEALDEGKTKEAIEAKLKEKIQVFVELLAVARELLLYEKKQERSQADWEKGLKQFAQLAELALEPYLTKDRRGIENLPQEIMRGFIGYYHAIELKTEQVSDLYQKYEEQLDRLAQDECFAQWGFSEASLESELYQRAEKLFTEDYNIYLRMIANTSELNAFLLDKQFENAYSRIAAFHELLKDINKIIFSPENQKLEVMKVLAPNLILKLTAACRNFIKDPFGTGKDLMADLAGSILVLNEEIKKVRTEQATLEAEKQSICWACFMKTKIMDLTTRINGKKQKAQTLQELIFDLKGLIEKYPQFRTLQATPIPYLIKSATKHQRNRSYSSMHLEGEAKESKKTSFKRVKSRRSNLAKVLPEISEQEEPSRTKAKKAW
jgi:hypothetical protein